MISAKLLISYSAMNRFLLSLMVLLGMLPASAQQVADQDSIQIIRIINDWNKAWQTKDYQLAAKGYSDDARFTNAFGDKCNGQKEIQNLLQQVFGLPFVMAGNSETTEHRCQPLNESTIVVHTAVTRKGQQMPDGSVLPDRQTTHMRVFGKEGNQWVIKSHLISDARDKQIVKH